MGKCPDCDSIEILSVPERGDGVCSRCHGDGKKLLSGLNERITGVPLECDDCNGSGQCQTCGGTGEI